MSEFADTDPLGAWLAGDWPARSEARCWLNAGCVRGYHGVMDEDGCQYAPLAGSGAPAGVEVAPGATDDAESPQGGGYCAADSVTACGLADECPPFHCREDRR